MIATDLLDQSHTAFQIDRTWWLVETWYTYTVMTSICQFPKVDCTYSENRYSDPCSYIFTTVFDGLINVMIERIALLLWCSCKGRRSHYNVWRSDNGSHRHNSGINYFEQLSKTHVPHVAFQHFIWCMKQLFCSDIKSWICVHMHFWFFNFYKVV